MKKSIVLTLLSIAFSAAVFGQFPQMKKAEERRQEMIRADEQRQQEEKAQTPNAPAPKPAVMNVDVQMALTTLEYKTFAEAKPNAATRIADGDPLWLNIKFNGKLERYVYTLRDADGGERYVLFVEFGPQGDVTAKSHQMIEFRKDELALTELKMSLSPGKAGHNKALAIFIKNVAASRPGSWNNELRITNAPAFPRGLNGYLAKTGFVCDFTKGITKYPAMKSVFQSMVLRDTPDETKLPIEGKFDSTTVRTDLVNRLAAEGVVPSQVYFAGDNWLEYSDNPISVRQFRTVTGVFRYQKGSACLYGTADITQAYDPMSDRFGESKIELRKDLPTPCAQIK